jgi:hypothetical protein
LTWALPKAELQEILKILQELLDKWESIVQLSPFAKAFRWPISYFLKQFNDDENLTLRIPSDV